MSVRLTLDKINKIAQVESDLVLDARLQRASKIKGILKRQQQQQTIRPSKKQKTKEITCVDDFFQTYKHKPNMSAKEKYFYFLSRNNILDWHDRSEGSQYERLPDFLKNQIHPENSDILAEEKLELLTDNALKSGWKTKLDRVEKIIPKTKKQRVEKEICRFILDMHVHKGFYLNPKNISKYSEEDFKLKFWAHIIEEFFSITQFFLHWGDTVPETFNALTAKPKVDLRILSSSSKPDYSVGEFAKVASATKLYEDKLKAALITKKHLNNLHVGSTAKILPFFLIMGFELCLLTLELADSKLYLIKRVTTCQFPITKDAINNGGIQDLIKCLGKMKLLIKKLEADHNNNKKDKVLHKMAEITGQASTHTIPAECTPVFWPTENHGLFLEDDDSENDDYEGEFEAEEDLSDTGSVDESGDD